MKRKYAAGFLCLVIMACNIQVPESLTVEGTPKVYLPLGSPFKSLKPEEKLEYYVSLDGIRDMMDKKTAGSEAEDKVKVYNYQAPGEFDKYQTYVVHYPLAEMPLDLTNYVNDALAEALDVDGEQIHIDVPVVPPTFPGLVTPYPYFLSPKGPVNAETPLYNILLDDMYKMVFWVKGNEVEDGEFGIEIPYSKGFEDNLMVKIPGFEINEYIYGVKDGDKLRFISDETTFYPGKLDNGNLQIFFKVTGPCPGTEMPIVVFKWKKALINTKDAEDDDRFKGKYTIENALGQYLGTGVSFNDVSGYMYVEGIDEATLTLTYQQNGKAPVELYHGGLTNQKRPAFSDTMGKLPQQSLTDTIQLKEMFDFPDDVTNVTLSYQIDIDALEIENKEDDTISGRTITADLVILLPLVFKAETSSGFAEYSDYAKISLNDLLPKPSEGETKEDLFFRDKDGGGMLSQISLIKISFKNYRNDILEADELGILLTAERPGGEAPYQNYFQMTGKEPTLLINNFADLPNPFNPGFDVLVKKQEGRDYAILGIKRQAPNSIFDFTIMVEARADINQTITF